MIKATPLTVVLVAFIVLSGLAPAAFGSGFAFSTIAVPGASVTQAFGINNAGQIVGAYYTGTGQHGFLYENGVFTTIDVPGAEETWAVGINNAGQIVGAFRDCTGVHGFLYDGGTFTIIDAPGAFQTDAYGINTTGQIVGVFVVDDTGWHGFLYEGATFVTIDEPRARSTITSGINDAGQIVGFFETSPELGEGGPFGFLYDGGTFTEINVPGMTSFTIASGINNAGQIVGFFDNPRNRGFLYDRGTFTPIDVPGADTIASGINDVGQIVGAFDDNLTGIKGFLATPVATQPPVASFTSACSGLACSFDGSSSSDPDGTVVSYSWNFGDGTTESGATVSHAYAGSGTFTVTLIVLDNGGATGTQSQSVAAINAPPVASFTSSCSGLRCSLTGSASSDSDGTITSYSWRFGDGTTGSGPDVSHTFAGGGTFTVTLTVTDNGGATGSQSKSVSVVNTPPLASFVSACSGLTCSFDGAASSDADGAIASYSWNFGDGTSGSGSTVNHTYTTAGTYSVALIVTDNAGATGTRSASVTVSQAHVGDLDGASTNQRSTWTAIVTITVHDSSHRPVANASVNGSWSGGGGPGSCATNGGGQCAVARSTISKSNASATFTVTNITHVTLTYASIGNHDPDGDSNGTTIIVKRP